MADDLHGQYDACIAKFTASGLRDLVDQLDASSHEFVIKKSGGIQSTPDSVSKAADGTGTGGTTKWNPSDTSPFEGDGVLGDPCATLYHEMSHLADYDKGVNRRDTCRYTSNGQEIDTRIPVNEVKATRKENVYRDAQNPKLPPRTAYGRGTSLPPPGTECLPKPPEPPSRGCSAGCAIGAGDPHLKSFDDFQYDLQAVGEFVLTRTTAGDPLEVQGRMSALAGVRTVSLFSAAAADVGGDHVGVYRSGDGLRVKVGGSAADLPIGVTQLPKGGAIERFDRGLLEIRWPDTSALQAQAVGGASVRLSLQLADTRGGKVEGLFGNFDGKPEGDLVVRGGQGIGEKPSFEALYRSYGNSWRISQRESLFDYGPGETTDTFTDRTFPDRPVSAGDLPNRAVAEAICRAAGVAQPMALEWCILDVGLTGEVAFAFDAVTTQRLVATGATTVLAITEPEATAQLTFNGAAGQKVFVDVPSSTLPDQCGVVLLLDPAGAVLAGGCIISGKGLVDGTVLPMAGQYTIVLDPAERATGTASVRVITALDQDAAISPDGAAVTATVAQPGAVSRLHFAGAAGQKVFVDVPSSTLPDQCGVVLLLDPAGAVLAGGCIISGKGLVDGTALPAAGQYTIVVDPAERATGTAQVLLHR